MSHWDISEFYLAQKFVNTIGLSYTVIEIGITEVRSNMDILKARFQDFRFDF